MDICLIFRKFIMFCYFWLYETNLRIYLGVSGWEIWDMLVQPWREVPVRIAGDHWHWEHTSRGMPARGLWWVERTALRREQLDNSSSRLNLQGMKAKWCSEQKEKSWDSLILWHHLQGGCKCNSEAPLERKKWQYACRLVGLSSHKEGVMWHDAFKSEF